MPLVTFSKILSSKTFARNTQLYSSSTVSTTSTATVSVSASDYSAQQQQQHDYHLDSPPLITPPRTPSTASSPNKSLKDTIGRSRDRASKAFTFSLDSFNVVASLRTRSSKIKSVHSPHPESVLCPGSRPVSHQSQSVSVYSGYEDEEYGEPEADAEEIRRPSGLGKRASLADMDMSQEVAEEAVAKYGVDHASMNEYRPIVAQETESRNSVSDTSDSESLVEIRYPSGLGNIKLAILPSDIEQPLSTYPHFGPGVVYDDTPTADDDKPIPTSTPQQASTAAAASPPRSSGPTPSPSASGSSYLSTLLPILIPYLSMGTFTSLARVDRAVGKAARDILWTSISMSVTIRSAQIQNQTHSRNGNGRMSISIDGHGCGRLGSGKNIDTYKLLDVISSSATGAGDVARLVKSLEMTCQLDSSAPVQVRSSFSQRSRPPPLILVPPSTTTPLRFRDTVPVSGPGSAPKLGQELGLAPAPGSEPELAPPSPPPSRPRSVPLLSAMKPNTHAVHEELVLASGASPGNSEQDMKILQADVQDTSPSKKLHRASLVLRNPSITLRSITHSKAHFTSKIASATKTSPASNSNSKANSPPSNSKTTSPLKSKSSNVPDALRASISAAKLRPSGLRLPQSLSLFRSRSAELLGLGHGNAGTLASSQNRNQNPTSPSEGAKADSLIPVKHLRLPSRAHGTQWKPPAEWDRLVVTPDSTPRFPPPPSVPLPSPKTGTGTGWNASSEWHANPPSPSPPTSFRPTPSHTPTNPDFHLSATAFRTRPRIPSFSASPTTTHSQSHPDLRLSPSLPSLRGLNSPPLSPQSQSQFRPRSNYLPDDVPSPASAMTTVPSPITPYSAISLSAFPLPPPDVAPSVPLFPPEYLYMFPPEPVVSPACTPSPFHSPSPLPQLPSMSANALTPTCTATTPTPRNEVEESCLPPGLATALKKMVNLEHVTLRYVSSSHRDSGSNNSQSPYTSMRESIDLSLIKKANESLGAVLPGLDSLKSLKVICQTPPHDEECRRWWEEATESLADFELDVTCVQDGS